MVKKLVTLLVFALLPALCFGQNFGASFSISKDREEIAVGDKFQIKFDLQNSEAYSAPDVSKFPESLKVSSQKQQQNFSYVNGAGVKSRSWIYEVSSSKPGNITIPKISIQSDAGVLYTNPLSFNVKSTSDIPNVTLDKEIFIEAKVDKFTPYIEEPIIYQTKVYHLAEIESAELVKPKSQGAVIEQISEPKTGNKKLNGVEYNTIEVNYLVTPVKSGKIKIKPSILRGKVYKDVKSEENQKQEFDNFFDPFALIDGGDSDKKNKQKKLVPFTVASNAVKLEVKPADVSVSPWLALYNLEIVDEINIDGKKVTTNLVSKLGEPITQKISLTAIGKSGDLLPEIENFVKSDDFKIYADKPDSSRDTLATGSSFAEKIKGVKSQNFTYIPQKIGKTQLPEVKITYWNLKENKAIEVTLPKREIFITNQESSTPQNQEQIKEELKDKSEVTNKPEQQYQEEKANIPEPNKQSLEKLITITISTLVFLILALLAKLSSMKKQIHKKVEKITTKTDKAPESKIKNKIITESNSNIKKPVVEKKITEQNDEFIKPMQNYSYDSKLSNAISLIDILKILQEYAYKNLNMPKNSAAVLIAQNISRKFNIHKYEIVKICSEIDGAIYAKKEVNLNEVKSGLSKIFAIIDQKIKDKNSKKRTDSLPQLNPDKL